MDLQAVEQEQADNHHQSHHQPNVERIYVLVGELGPLVVVDCPLDYLVDRAHYLPVFEGLQHVLQA